VIRFGAIAIIVSALFVFLNQILDVSWQILTIAATVVILLILGGCGNEASSYLLGHCN